MSSAVNTGVGVSQLLLASVGIVALGIQLTKLLARQNLYERDIAIEGERPAASVHLGLYTYSFFSYLLVVLWALALETREHLLYLAAPRFVLLTLLLIILWLVAWDRKSFRAWAAFGACTLTGLALGWCLWDGYAWLAQYREQFGIPLLVDGFILAVLANRQNRCIDRNGNVGGVSALMHIIFLFKNFSLLAYGLAVGKNDGLALTISAAVNLLVQFETMWVLWRYRHTLHLRASGT